MNALQQELRRLDGRPYPAYKDLRGRSYEVEGWKLCLEHVQGDPFASPSRLAIHVSASTIDLPSMALESVSSRRATADFLHRSISSHLRGSSHNMGSGKSGLLEILSVGQEMLERTALSVEEDGSVQIRLSVGLPAQGRRIRGRAASVLLTEAIPDVLDRTVSKKGVDTDALRIHIECLADQMALRSALKERKWVAFLAEESVLPRRSGVDDRPLPKAVPLAVPEGLRGVLETPHSGSVSGLAIPEGVTLIVGGGYHGKSTLLSVLARGVYDHIPGDGREKCVTREDAVCVRAEDGRAIRGVNLRPFIRNLPLGKDTTRFYTDDASGSTSQAASVVEALESGSQALLIDEDTAATNFMIRDARMRRLVPSEKEPIIPYLDRVRQLYEEKGVSSILVVGGAGDYLDVADCVIQMDEYRPLVVTDDAREVARALPLGEAAPQAPDKWDGGDRRIPDPASLDPSRGKRGERVRSVKTRSIEFGREEIDVSLLSQLVDPAQARMIGDVLVYWARGGCDGLRSIPELLREVEALIESRGLDGVLGRSTGDRARPRSYEMAMALNRLRSLRLRDSQTEKKD